jgi:hypothetical protein
MSSSPPFNAGHGVSRNTGALCKLMHAEAMRTPQFRHLLA